MRQSIATLILVSLFLSACGGGGAAVTTAPGQPTAAAPGQPTAPPAQATATAAPAQPTTAPVNPGGSTTVTVTLVGGPDAGTYTGTIDPLCSYGLVGPGIWGTQFSHEGGPGQVSSVQMVAPPASSEDAHFLTTVTIGPQFTGNNYELVEGEGSAAIDDQGSTATIQVTGTTADGVAVDVTVNCPSVIRF